jgi:hypothetical protein
MSSITEMFATLAAGFVLVAVIALLVSKNSNTAGVIQASASGYGNILDVAISPVTGKAVSPNLSYPGSNGIGMGGFSTGSFGTF